MKVLKLYLIVNIILCIGCKASAQGFILKKENREKLVDMNTNFSVFTASPEIKDCSSIRYIGYIKGIEKDSLLMTFNSVRTITTSDEVKENSILTFSALQEVKIPKENIYFISQHLSDKAKRSNALKGGAGLLLFTAAIGTSIGALFTKNKNKQRNLLYITGGELVMGTLLLNSSFKNRRSRYKIKHPMINPNDGWVFK